MDAKPSRRRLVAAAVVATTLALAACRSAGPDTGPSGKLRVWVLQDAGQNAVQRKAIMAFNKSSGVEAGIVRINPGAYRDRLQAAMGSPDAPDIFFNWGGDSIRPFVAAGRLVDLTLYLRRDKAWRNVFLPTVLEAGRIGGRYYGVPLRGMQPVVLFYNKQVFSKVGAQPPTTWGELLRLVDTFKAAGVTPFALPGAQEWTELMWLEYLTDRYGGAGVFQRIQAGQRGAWRDPAIAKALATIQDLVGRGAFGNGFSLVDYNQGGASTMFARGRAAMYLMGSWEMSNLVSFERQFATSGLGFTSFPMVPGGKGEPSAVVGNPTNFFSVNARSAHVDAAVAFLEQAMASDAYVQDLIRAGDVPAIAGLGPKLARSPNPEFASWIYQLVQDASSFTLSWDQALPGSSSKVLLASVQKVFARELTPAGFVRAMEQAA